MGIKEKVYEYIDDTNNKMGTMEEVARAFDIPRDQMKEFKKIIESMQKEGLIHRTRSGKLGTARRLGLTLGKVQGNHKGFAFVIPEAQNDEKADDIFISRDSLNGALHGDEVVVRVLEDNNGDRRRSGEVLKIITRANETIIGMYQKSKSYGFVVPLESKISSDIFVLNKDNMDAQNGQVVEVKITKWGEEERSPEGRIIDILGYEGDKGVDIAAVIKKYGLPYVFTEDVINEANLIPETISKEEINRREDFREDRIVTIDGSDAKDFDDAVSIEKLENGNYKLGVHIADVTHYVKYGMAIDEEALERGTSVYLVDRVIPMLPEKLSNNVCSLKPDEDRLTMSIIMEINKSGKVVNHNIYEGVIRSSARLIYDDVSNFLEHDNEKARKLLEEKNIADDLKIMEELAEILYIRREKRGAIGFNFPESQIVLDKEGRPTEIKEREMRVGNKIIEEFMLISNETVSEHMFWTDTPFLYRIHEDPDDEKVEAFKKFLNLFGYKLRAGSDGIEPRHFQELLKKIKGTNEERVISMIMLRALKKAKYSTIEEGHFGLAADYYSHFTSPIRRYPDLQIHRIIREFINGKLDKSKLEYYKKTLPMVAEITSMAERRSDDAERETYDIKKAEYMTERIGEEYTGIISSVISSGFFVELDNTVEGFVPIQRVEFDYYHYDEDTHQMIGEMTKTTFKLGDKVRIRVVSASPATRKIDFELIENISGE